MGNIGRMMTSLGLVAGLGAMLCACGGTVTGYLVGSNGQGLTNSVITFTPKQTPLLYGISTVVSKATTQRVTNGLFAVSVMGGQYRVTVDQMDPFWITVPDESSTWAISSLIQTGLSWIVTAPPTISPWAATIARTNVWGGPIVVVPGTNAAGVLSQGGDGLLAWSDFNALVPTNGIAGTARGYATLGEALTIPVNAVATNFTVSCYERAGDGGGGQFYYDAGSSAATNMGLCFATTSGTGRVCRVVSGLVEAKWFRARGDGLTDDTRSLQDALDAGGTLHIPTGTYLIDGGYQLGETVGLLVTNNASIMMDPGAVLQVIPNALWTYDIIRITNAVNVTISGGAIRGDYGEHTDPQTEFGYGVHIMGSRGIVIDGTEISYCEGDGLIARDGSGNVISDGVTIRNCKVHHCRRNGISFVGAANVRVTGNEIYSIGGTAPEAGIDVEPQDNTTNTSYVVSGNVLRDNGTYGLLAGIYPSATNCFLYGLQVSDNVVLNNGQSGIMVTESADPAVTWIRSVYSGNLCSSNYHHGLHVRSHANAPLITGNTLSVNGWRGFDLEDVTNAVVTGNLVSGNGLLTGGGSVNARISSGAGCYVVANTIHKGSGPAFPYYGLSLYGTDHRVGPNSILDAGSGQSILDNSTGSVINEPVQRAVSRDVRLQSWSSASSGNTNGVYLEVTKNTNSTQIWQNSLTNATIGRAYATVLRNNYTGSATGYGDVQVFAGDTEVMRLQNGANRGKVLIPAGGVDIASVNNARLYGGMISQGNRSVTSSNFFFYGPLSYNSATEEYWRLGYFDGSTWDAQITVTTNGYLGVRKTLPTEAIETSGNVKGVTFKGASVNISNTVAGAVTVLVDNADNTTGSSSVLAARGANGTDAGFKLLSGGGTVTGSGGPRDLVIFNNAADATYGKVSVSLHDGTAQRVTTTFEKNGDARLAGSVIASNAFFTNGISVGVTNIVGAIAGKAPAFSTGDGLTNVGGVLGGNYLPGTNVTYGTNAYGAVTVSAGAAPTAATGTHQVVVRSEDGMLGSSSNLTYSGALLSVPGLAVSGNQTNAGSVFWPSVSSPSIYTLWDADVGQFVSTALVAAGGHINTLQVSNTVTANTLYGTIAELRSTRANTLVVTSYVSAGVLRSGQYDVSALDPSSWPATPYAPGTVSIVSSNGTPYVLLSDDGFAWASTNRLLSSGSEITTGVGVTNTSGALSWNYAAGTNMVVTVGSSGQATLSHSPELYRYIWIDAAAMHPTNSTMPEAKTFVPTNGVQQIDVLAFDSTTTESASFKLAMPYNWDQGTLKAKFYWSTLAGGTNCSTTNMVRWQLDAGAVHNLAALTNTLGTAQVAESTNASPESLNITPATPALTVNGSPAAGDLVLFRVMRNALGATTNVAGDAYLHGLQIQYKVSNTLTTAW